MRKPIPVIHETADELKQRLQQERHPLHRQRLQAVYLLATGQARYRQDVAALLALDRNTVGHWLARYVPKGKRSPLTPEHLAQLQQALEQPNGVGSYGEIQQWIATTSVFSSATTPSTSWSAINCGPSSRYLVRVTQKNDEVVAAFCRDAAAHLRQVLPPQLTNPIKVWAGDESRFGLQPIRRRRITARCVEPIGRYQHRFENFYLYGLVAPPVEKASSLGFPSWMPSMCNSFWTHLRRHGQRASTSSASTMRAVIRPSLAHSRECHSPVSAAVRVGAQSG